MYLKLNRPIIEIITQERALLNPEMSSLKFCLCGGVTATRSKNRGSEAHINWTCHMWTGWKWVVGIGPDLRVG